MVFSQTTQHSQNISQNPHVFAVIFNSSPKETTGEAVYIEGNAYEIAEKELTHATQIYAKKAAINDEEKQEIEKIQDFLGNSELRMYKMIPKNIYTNTAEKWHGKWIDKRIPVILD